ncbi:DNA-directed RNA polymerase subunit beta, partial [uncultured Duncaniella sp.]
GTNALSQFMDQTNPLAEITHKRRMSALGPGGLSRERAGFEVRDVHYTHYGRLCPIETPEGPNIGLISSLCVYAKINDLGFIETPYREVKDGVVNLKNDEVVYLTAEIEEGKIIAQGNAPVEDDGKFINDRVKARLDADFPIVAPDQVELMDVSPTQIASIAASLIPFLEHDDANRALMGSNMMRQAVPLLRSESPIVGTGIEGQLIHDSRTQIMAEREGTIEFVDARVIRIRYDRTEDEEFVSFEDSVKEYHLPKFRKTNQSTTIDLRPICNKGQRVKRGDILTEGYSTEKGELALGRNLKVAFMPWKGYNYEDAIVLNERVVREDILTSVHVDEYTLEVRETKRGMEELTSDIPNVSEDATKDLDERGIVRVGAHIVPGDIMIGKITPKGESDPTPEEKLLRAIFGDKAGDVKDASLKASPSLKGVVIGTHLFQKAEKKKTKKSASAVLPKLDEEYEDRLNDLKNLLISKLMTLTEGKTSQGVKDFLGTDIIPKGSNFSAATLREIDFDTINLSKWTTDARINDMIRATIVNYLRKSKEIDAELRRKKFDISIGDELPSGIMKLAKVYVAKKRKISVGDKMAGRHGNKGIVSRIVRQEDMPFLADGTPVDICLNPLGVPSRMNLGQIFETVLGWAGRELGEKFATPIFDGATLEDLNEWTDKAGLPRYGKTYLYDGGTGERFDQPATVGVIYMLKLGHMVEDKMHARSIGPYSLITQQPLGGKAQFGGQRFGEMEVWALEAFGAAHILQEIITVKSDDVTGRSKTYEAIVKGEAMPPAGIPESLNVLLHELRGLGLSINLEQ